MASNRRWRCQFRCRGSRRESAVAQLFSLGDITFTKTYNTKLAFVAFTFIIILDVVLFALGDPWYDRWFTATWFSINFPGLLLIYPFEGMLRPDSWSRTCLVICDVLFSAVVWSSVTGYVFRRKNVA
jgi:hypothetical protein